MQGMNNDPNMMMYNDPNMMMYNDPNMMMNNDPNMMMNNDPNMMMYNDPNMMMYNDPNMMNNNENNIMENNENEYEMTYFWNGVNYSDYNAYRDATFYNGIYYLPEENGMYNDPASAMAAYNNAMGGGGGGGNLSYAGEGTYGTAQYRPPYTYTSQAEYDAAMSGGYIGYMSMAAYSADSAARGEGGGGGGYEATSGLADIVYSTGSLIAVGNIVTNQSYELQAGDDQFGQPNMEAGGTRMSDYVDGGDGNDTIYTGANNDYILGGNGNDYLDGGDSNDVLVGGAGSDFLVGNAGTDVLVGGTTSDSLMNAMDFTFNATGDGVQDTFIFTDGDGNANPNFTNKIVDFEQGIDKFAYSDDGGTTWLATPFAGGIGSTLTSQSSGGMTMVMKTDVSEIVFYVQGSVTFDDTDVTTTVA